MHTHTQVAAFLRAQHDNLDKTQLGELLGHHDDFALAVMHAWIDSEPSMGGQAIDQSLRRLLGGFRLPGEAQKIDRIMEKFAEVCWGESQKCSGKYKSVLRSRGRWLSRGLWLFAFGSQ